MGFVGEAKILYSPSEKEERKPGTLYPRIIMLEHNGDANGRLFATFEHYTIKTPAFPIYESLDDGETWTKVAVVEDRTNGWGMRYQPQLFELPEPIGDMPKGTILCAGLSFPEDASVCRIELYKSNDLCRTWQFVSTIATGGRLSTDGTSDPVWEPFFLTNNGTLICYYSDSRDRVRSQKLVHVTSKDGKEWGAPIEDVSLTPFDQRPGMTIITRLKDGRYFIIYEIVTPTTNIAYYKITDNPEDFNATDKGTEIHGTDGSVLCGTPYVIWIDDGSEYGAIVASGWNQKNLYVNRKNGDKDSWEVVTPSIDKAYSRCLCLLKDKKSFLVMGGNKQSKGDFNDMCYCRMSL